MTRPPRQSDILRAIRAAENGATAHELMALFGWVNLKEAELYTREADRRRLSLTASSKLSRTTMRGKGRIAYLA